MATERRNTGPHGPPGRTRELVRALRARGLKASEIAAELGLGKSSVAYHLRRLDEPPDLRFARRYDWAEIRRYYEAGHSFRKCRAKFGFNSQSWYDAVARGDIVPRPRLMPMEILLVKGRRTNRHHLKTRLFSDGLKQPECERCGLSEWQGAPLSVELHHINGDGLDNRIQNLSILCPNCHSQTPTWGGKNRRNGRRNLTLL